MFNCLENTKDDGVDAALEGKSLRRMEGLMVLVGFRSSRRGASVVVGVRVGATPERLRAHVRQTREGRRAVDGLASIVSVGGRKQLVLRVFVTVELKDRKGRQAFNSIEITIIRSLRQGLVDPATRIIAAGDPWP